MAYDVMDAMLIMALHAQQNHSVKEFKRIAYKLSKKTTPAVARGLMNAVRVSDTPKVTLFYHIDQFIDLLNCCSEISKMGDDCIGMIMVDDLVYPIRVNFSADTHDDQCEDAKWLLENEVILATRTVQQTLRELQLQRITCRVLFFNNRGFSGVIRPFVNVGMEVWT